MIYSNHAFSYDHHNDRDEQSDNRRANYGRGRAYKAPRRRSRKRTASTPGCGLGARRQKRWAW